MRIARLTLDRYGAFSGMTVRFGEGLTVVHGPNEAGKTTISHAIGDLLWGLVPRLHRYAFDVAPSRLQMTATVDGASGPQVLTVSSRGWRDATGTPVDPWWRNGPVDSRLAWEAGYGLDRDRLREGGQAVLRDGGDLADLLFQARTGMDLAAARDRLVTEAEKLWKRHRGARGELRTHKAAVDELRARFADALHSADAVMSLAEELQDAERKLETVRAAHARTTTAMDAAQRDARARPVAASLAGVRREIDTVISAGAVLSASDLERYDMACAALATARATLAQLEADEAALDAVPLPAPDPEALAIASEVDRLRRDEGAESERRTRLERLRSQESDRHRDLRKVVAALDPSLVLADDAALRATAPDLVLPAETVGMLDRLADGLEQAVRAVEDARGAVTAAEAGLAPHVPDAHRSAHGRWEGARQLRDRTWAQIRSHWLAGDLPEPGVRARLATDLDGALVTTDVAAGEAATEAEAFVEARTRAQERQRDLERAEADLQACTAQLQNSSARWTRALGSALLPETLDVPAWRTRAAGVARISELLLALAHLDEESGGARADSDRFCDRVRAAASPLEIPTPDPLAALTAAWRRVEEARRANAAWVERERQRAKITEKRAAARTTARQAGQSLDELAARSGDGDLEALVVRSRRLVDLRRDEQAVLDRLRAAAPGDDPDELVARLADMSDAQIEEVLGRARDDATDAIAARDMAQGRRTQLADQLLAAKQDRDAATVHQQHVDALDEMAELTRRWARLQLMAGLLDRVVRAEDTRADSSLLAHASALAVALTAGRVRELRIAETSGGNRTLAIHVAGGLDLETAGLSEGTADQLFLALRLAGIRQRQAAARASGAETLPVVLDDVLVAHDDPRTAAALRALVQEARDHQIVLFTHHRAVALEARAAGACVEEIGRPVPAPPHASARPRADGDADDAAAVRAWARAHGIETSSRGRIPRDVLAAYHAAIRPGG